MFGWLFRSLFGSGKETRQAIQKVDWRWTAREMGEPKVSPYRAYLTEIDPGQYRWAAREVATRDGAARLESSRDHAERQETRQAQAGHEQMQASAEKTYDRIVTFEEFREALRVAREKEWGVANDNNRGRDR